MTPLNPVAPSQPKISETRQDAPEAPKLLALEAREATYRARIQELEGALRSVACQLESTGNGRLMIVRFIEAALEAKTAGETGR